MVERRLRVRPDHGIAAPSDRSCLSLRLVRIRDYRLSRMCHSNFLDASGQMVSSGWRRASWDLASGVAGAAHRPGTAWRPRRPQHTRATTMPGALARMLPTLLASEACGTDAL